MAASFNEQFDQHGQWRRDFAQRLRQLSGWLRDHDLVNPAVDERLRRLEAHGRDDKVTVAFVAEFSRGKSELINAIFFAQAVLDFQGRSITHDQLIKQWRISIAPTLLFFGPGGKEVAERMEGGYLPDFYGPYLDERLIKGRQAL